MRVFIMTLFITANCLAHFETEWKSVESMDKTQWVVIKDLTHHVLYFRSYSDLTLQKIDMKKLNFEPGAPKQRLKLENDQAHIIDATERLKQGPSASSP